MPTFTIPLHEANDCHVPAGSAQGGQFCSDKSASSQWVEGPTASSPNDQYTDPILGKGSTGASRAKIHGAGGAMVPPIRMPRRPRTVTPRGRRVAKLHSHTPTGGPLK